MSPEQVIGKKVDGRSDLYSLGVILYELSTGARPFKGDNLAAIFHAITNETPARPEAVNTGVPSDFSHILMRCIQKNPAERYGSGHALSGALRAFLKAQEPPLAGTVEKKKSPLGMVIAALIVLVDMGPFKVESVPEGAQVFIDGTFKGKSPLSIEVPVGGHEVSLSIPGYYEWEARVQVEKGEGEPLKVELVPAE
jgi:serine/threonine protein kinase